MHYGGQLACVPVTLPLSSSPLPPPRSPSHPFKEANFDPLILCIVYFIFVALICTLAFIISSLLLVSGRVSSCLSELWDASPGCFRDRSIEVRTHSQNRAAFRRLWWVVFPLSFDSGNFFISSLISSVMHCLFKNMLIFMCLHSSVSCPRTSTCTHARTHTHTRTCTQLYSIYKSVLNDYTKICSGNWCLPACHRELVELF